MVFFSGAWCAQASIGFSTVIADRTNATRNLFNDLKVHSIDDDFLETTMNFVLALPENERNALIFTGHLNACRYNAMNAIVSKMDLAKLGPDDDAARCEELSKLVAFLVPCIESPRAIQLRRVEGLRAMHLHDAGERVRAKELAVRPFR